MAYLDTLNYGYAMRAKKPKENRSNAYAAQFPEYEQTLAQYTQPSPYTLAQQGFRSNTLVFACISRRMEAVAAAPMWIYDISSPQAKVLADLQARKVLKSPNERMSERQFWQVTQMYLDIAGSAVWEIERNKAGDPIHLWPMRPDWCAFLRGDGRPIRAVQYTPQGLPSQEIPIDDVILFQYPDPVNLMLKGYSPTMAALKDVVTDNTMSAFLTQFLSSGARFSGVLTTDQDLDDIEAERIRQRWKTQHGGVENWNDVVVLGHGTTYQTVSMNFDEMAFPELDARTETRICMAFQIPPILLGTKSGLASSSYSNYEQARKAWYEEWVNPQWEFLAEQFGVQMLKEPDKNGGSSMPDTMYCEFMTKKIPAMQINRDLAFRRAVAAARANTITRDEARAEMGFDAIDNKPTFIGPTTNSSVGIDVANGEIRDEIADQPLDSPTDDLSRDQEEITDAAVADQSMERKQFAAFAAKRIKEGHPEALNDFVWNATPKHVAKEIVRKTLLALNGG